ncbi:YidH family protein [Nocardia australiensis]|uniref:YidH family protein n=1 Tax=Nocardia australiensis TaxID=2887191 RepID=UPI001D14F48E|nr:DUF202 domain-containing protein [Nocardia australiensis]
MPVHNEEPTEPGTGEREPDYRFTLANERTFLAWIRTALALLAGAVAIHQLAAPAAVPEARTIIALLCTALSAVLAVGALRHWRTTQSAMRRELPLPGTAQVPLLSVGIVTIALVVALTVLFG